MDGLVDIPDYLQRSVALLLKNAWIFRESNTKCVEMEVLDNIPEAWTEALSKLNNDEFNQMPCATAATVPKDLEELLSTAHQLKLEFNGEDQRAAVHSTTEKLIKGMSPKKSHEIIRLAEFIHAYCRSADVLVDLGCGLGYLSEYLHAKFGFQILALECDRQRVDGAKERQRKFYPASRDHVKYHAHFITEYSMDWIKERIGLDFDLVEHPKISLVGLHACGDLTINSLKLAANEPLVGGLVIMPCCYHRASLINANEFRNFPVSRTLGRIMDETRSSSSSGGTSPRGSVSPTFHRPFLRLACQQSVKKWQKMSEQEHSIHGNQMYCRALAGALAAAREASGTDSGPLSLIRRKAKINYSPSISFDGLCSEFGLFTGSGQSIPWTDDDLQRYTKYAGKYPNGGFLTEILTGLQTALQEICENVVLLDKVQYVKDEHIGCNLRIEKVTNDELSPRCYALVLAKETGV